MIILVDDINGSSRVTSEWAKDKDNLEIIYLSNLIVDLSSEDITALVTSSNYSYSLLSDLCVTHNVDVYLSFKETEMSILSKKIKKYSEFIDTSLPVQFYSSGRTSNFNYLEIFFNSVDTQVFEIFTLSKIKDLYEIPIKAIPVKPINTISDIVSVDIDDSPKKSILEMLNNIHPIKRFTSIKSKKR